MRLEQYNTSLNQMAPAGYLGISAPNMASMYAGPWHPNPTGPMYPFNTKIGYPKPIQRFPQHMPFRMGRTGAAYGKTPRSMHQLRGRGRRPFYSGRMPSTSSYYPNMPRQGGGGGGLYYQPNANRPTWPAAPPISMRM